MRAFIIRIRTDIYIYIYIYGDYRLASRRYASDPLTEVSSAYEEAESLWEEGLPLLVEAMLLRFWGLGFGLGV